MARSIAPRRVERLKGFFNLQATVCHSQRPLALNSSFISFLYVPSHHGAFIHACPAARMSLSYLFILQVLAQASSSQERFPCRPSTSALPHSGHSLCLMTFPTQPLSQLQFTFLHLTNVCVSHCSVSPTEQGLCLLCFPDLTQCPHMVKCSLSPSIFMYLNYE